MAKTKGKTEKPAGKASETRDISSYVCRAMVYGAVSGHGIGREEIERLCERYSDENPKVDVTKLPLVLLVDDGSEGIRAAISLAKRHCRKSAVVSKDGKSVLIVGLAAKEIVSKLDVDDSKVQKLKTKYRIPCGFPLKRALKCFGGERVADHVRKSGEEG